MFCPPPGLNGEDGKYRPIGADESVNDRDINRDYNIDEEGVVLHESHIGIPHKYY